MSAVDSLSQLSDPGQEFQSPLHMSGGDGAGVLAGSFLQGPLGQMVQEPGQTMASLHEQLQGGRFEWVGVDANFLQTGLDIPI